MGWRGVVFICIVHQSRTLQKKCQPSPFRYDSEQWLMVLPDVKTWSRRERGSAFFFFQGYQKTFRGISRSKSMPTAWQARRFSKVPDTFSFTMSCHIFLPPITNSHLLRREVSADTLPVFTLLDGLPSSRGWWPFHIAWALMSVTATTHDPANMTWIDCMAQLSPQDIPSFLLFPQLESHP